MSSKEKYCYKILKSHSIVVDFDGEPPRVNVPSLVEGETFKHWKNRILGEDVKNVCVYYAEEPAPQTRISTLQRWGDSEHFHRMFKKLEKEKAKKHASAVKQAVNETTKQLETFPRELLEIILDDKKSDLEPTVSRFFEQFLSEAQSDINTKELLGTMIDKYNALVKITRAGL
jgi:hypothetical protein